MQTIQLGTMDLMGHAYGQIAMAGGFFDIKQDGATTLRTGARKGDPKGAYVSFSVCFDTEATAKAFLAYVAPYSPDDPDFDETGGADIDLYIRTDDWKYRVWSVVTKPTPLNKERIDYIQYNYDVICYLYSPYSEAATAQDIDQPMTKICVTPNGTIYGLDAYGAVWVLTTNWARLVTAAPVALVRISANDTHLYGLTAAGAAYCYTSGAWSEVFSLTGALDISVASDGTVYHIASDSKLMHWNGATWDVWDGVCLTVTAKNSTEAWVTSASGTWKCISDEFTSVDGTLVKEISITNDGSLYGIGPTDVALKWNGSSWDSLTKTVIAVGTKGASEAHFIDPNGNAWKYTTGWVAEGGSSSLNNSDGHISSSPEITVTCASRPENVTVTIADSETLILAEQANSVETWELIGNENELLETYEDTITAGAIWAADWTGDGTFDTDHIELDDTESAYILLSGPHSAKKPVLMTATLSLDSGGATGLAYVDVSPDAVSWANALTEADFTAAADGIRLPDTVYMTDIYIRIRCASGTSGKKVNVGSIKFEVDRWIEDGAVPTVAVGATKIMSVSATGGTVSVSGTFAPRQKFI